MIKAKCYSDDHCIEVDFDATSWFEDASDEEILALAECEWGGDYASDAVAHYMADQNEEVKTMFDYLDLRGRIETIGFECHVNSSDAIAWIKENRKDLLTTINNLP